jgi:multiple sugar transport system substrate-binding protein
VTIVKTLWTLILITGLLLAIPGIGAGQSQVQITYWQYFFESKVNLVEKLIPQFESQNPGIKIVHEHFPYDAYNQKVASAVPAGQGPDVVNLFYGWLPLYVGSGYLQPLPADVFPATEIERDYVPMIKNSKYDGKYWSLPTAVRSLALFYNDDLLRAGSIARAPVTWEEFLTAAEKTTVRDAQGRITTEGFGIAPNGQDHHLVREVLFRQWGASPYSADGKRVTYNTPAGAEALKWYTDLVTRAKVGQLDFFPGDNGYRNAFMAGRATMIIDGSFAIAAIRRGTRANWGVVQLPRRTIGGEAANFGSYWVHGLTTRATGPKRDAAIKWLKFLTSEPVQRMWLDAVGELPARKSLIADPKLVADPVFGPFIAGLAYSRATFFLDETGQRQVMLDAINEVVINNKTPKQALDEAAAKEQKILDEFWLKKSKRP